MDTAGLPPPGPSDHRSPISHHESAGMGVLLIPAQALGMIIWGTREVLTTGRDGSEVP
jgi:hypothetical protein